MDTVLERKDWSGALKAVTHRNVGQRTRLEIDDPEIGAQWAGVDFPLHGVAYDPRDGRIEIMLGEFGVPVTHLTHSISGATGVDLLSDERGRDAVLRVAHGDGQTLLRFL